jgi:O-antigen/teichoic acid export membrane protein
LKDRAVVAGSPAASSLQKRLYRGIGATALGPLVTAVIQFGTVPLLLHAWGAAKYGDWLILSAIPSYLSLTNLGFGDASGSDMTMRVGVGDRAGALETFQSSWVLLLSLSAAVFSIAFCAVWWIPWHHWLHLSDLSDHSAAAVLIVLCAFVLAGQQWGVVESGYRCDGNYAVGTLIGNIVRFAETMTACVAGILADSLLYAALGSLVCRCLCLVGYYLYLRKKSLWLKFGLRHARAARIKALLMPAMAFMVLPLGSAISIQGFTILVGILLGPFAVTAFSTLRTLARINIQFVNVIGFVLWPELSSSLGAGNLGLARSLHRRAYQVVFAMSCVTGLLLWLFGPYVYHLWIGSAVSFDAVCFHVLLAVSLANSLWFTSSVVQMASNKHRPIAIHLLVAACLSFGLARLLIPQMGILGAACALLMVDGWMDWIVLRRSLKQLHDNFRDFFWAMINYRTATGQLTKQE